MSHSLFSIKGATCRRTVVRHAPRRSGASSNASGSYGERSPDTYGAGTGDHVEHAGAALAMIRKRG